MNQFKVPLIQPPRGDQGKKVSSMVREEGWLTWASSIGEMVRGEGLGA